MEYLNLSIYKLGNRMNKIDYVNLLDFFLIKKV